MNQTYTSSFSSSFTATLSIDTFVNISGLNSCLKYRFLKEAGWILSVNEKNVIQAN